MVLRNPHRLNREHYMFRSGAVTYDGRTKCEVSIAPGAVSLVVVISMSLLACSLEDKK